MLKRMHCGKLVSAEITTKELRKTLKNEPPERWEDVLRFYAFTHDMNPLSYPQHEDEGEAGNEFNAFFGFEIHGNICHISCTLLEHYYTDDDGEFAEGSDYDYIPCMTEEQFETIGNIVD